MAEKSTPLHDCGALDAKGLKYLLHQNLYCEQIVPADEKVAPALCAPESPKVILKRQSMLPV